jgi:hypothetical protein
MRSEIAVAILVAAFVLSLGHFWAYGQDVRGSVTFGSVRLVLGMPENAVIAKLAAEYDLVNVGGTGILWSVQAKHGPPFEVYGSVRFQDGKLIVVQKRWGPGNTEKGFEFSRILYLALKQLQADTLSSTCKIELKQDENTTANNKFIDFICGEKRVAVAILGAVKGPARDAAFIEEVLLP